MYTNLTIDSERVKADAEVIKPEVLNEKLLTKQQLYPG